MIAFRVELWCDGCGRHCGPGIANDDTRTLEILGGDLTEFAKFAGWTIDGAAHWCQRCTRNFLIAEVERDAAAEELERLPTEGGIQ